MTLGKAGALMTMDNMDLITSLMSDSEDKKDDDKKKQPEPPSNITSSSA